MNNLIRGSLIEDGFCPVTGCKLPGTKTCADCRVIRYCCKEHQKSDWKIHRPFCLANTFDATRYLDIPTSLPHWLQKYLRIVKAGSPEFQAFRDSIREKRNPTPIPENLVGNQIKSCMDMPVPYDGDDASRYKNLATHIWPVLSEVEPIYNRCERCHCKLVHQSAWYPCGTVVPRQMLVTFTDGTMKKMSLEQYKELKTEGAAKGGETDSNPGSLLGSFEEKGVLNPLFPGA